MGLIEWVEKYLFLFLEEFMQNWYYFFLKVLMWNYVNFSLIFIKIYQWSKKKLFPSFKGNFWTLNPIPLSVFLSLCQYHIVLIIVILQQILQLRSVNPFNCFLFQNCFGGSESFAFPCNSHIQNLEKNNEFFHRFLLTRILYLGERCYCFHTLDHQSNDVYWQFIHRYFFCWTFLFISWDFLCIYV